MNRKIAYAACAAALIGSCVLSVKGLPSVADALNAVETLVGGGERESWLDERAILRQELSQRLSKLREALSDGAVYADEDEALAAIGITEPGWCCLMTPPHSSGTDVVALSRPKEGGGACGITWRGEVVFAKVPARAFLGVAASVEGLLFRREDELAEWRGWTEPLYETGRSSYRYDSLQRIKAVTFKSSSIEFNYTESRLTRVIIKHDAKIVRLDVNCDSNNIITEVRNSGRGDK